MAEETPNPLNELVNYYVPCPECQTGAMRLQYLTYFTWLNEELVTVPNFPAWVCDLCGRREYDNRAVTWLNMLLNPETGRSTPRPRAFPPRSQRTQPGVE
jgi:YgiT-type zinc finger domain-containing protein